MIAGFLLTSSFLALRTPKSKPSNVLILTLAFTYLFSNLLP